MDTSMVLKKKKKGGEEVGAAGCQLICQSLNTVEQRSRGACQSL